jgi:hypothetical protein
MYSDLKETRKLKVSFQVCFIMVHKLNQTGNLQRIDEGQECHPTSSHNGHHQRMWWQDVDDGT